MWNQNKVIVFKIDPFLIVFILKLNIYPFKIYYEYHR